MCLSRKYLQAWYAGVTDDWYASLTPVQLETLRAHRAVIGRKADAKRAGSARRRASGLAHSQRQRKREPERYRARTAVGNAVRDGRLIKDPCEVCGAAKVEGHHDDYAKPLEVRWFCRMHHKAHHGHLRPDYVP